MQNQVKVRNSSMELLRIISMVMIVFHHFAIHGGFEFGASLSITHFWYNLIVLGGKVGVNIFVLISGYFLIDNDKKIFDISKILKFVGQILFYSILFYVIGILTGIVDLNIKDAIKTLLPLTFSRWWFASTYFVLYLLHPFLNKLLRSIDKSLYQKLLLLIVVCWSIIPTFTTSSFQSNSLLWFVTLYAIAGYIKLYGLNDKITTKHYFLIFFASFILTYLSSVVVMLLSNKWSSLTGYITYFYGQEKLPIVLVSLSLFMCFVTLKMNYRKSINALASATFGVYLIHENNIIRDLLWVDWFKNAQYQDSLFLIPYSILVVIAVYAVCSLVDLIRITIIEKPCMKMVNRYSDKIAAPFVSIATVLKNLIFGK